MYEYQTDHHFFAQVADGVEDIAAEELESNGAQIRRIARRGVHFEADDAVLYRSVYRSRLVTRIIAPLVSFDCRQADDIYANAGYVRWKEFMSPNETFAVIGSVSRNSKIKHSRYAALRVKDNIVDQFRDETGVRPDVDRNNPDVLFTIRIDGRRATIGLDVSGGSMHRRGYRKGSVDAPIQETLAAAVIRFSEWDGTVPIYDPMCGSGTLLSEALISYCRTPAGFLRARFGFERLPDFNRTLWEKVRAECNAAIKPPPKGLIAGSDISARAIRIARRNNLQLPHGDRVKLHVSDFRALPELHDQIIVCNPPYGVRLGDKDRVASLYREFGDFLKQKCKGSTAYLYLGDRTLIGEIGLKPSWKKPLSNGGLDGRLAKFVIY